MPSSLGLLRSQDRIGYAVLRSHGRQLKRNYRVPILPCLLPHTLSMTRFGWAWDFLIVVCRATPLCRDSLHRGSVRVVYSPVKKHNICVGISQSLSLISQGLKRTLTQLRRPHTSSGCTESYRDSNDLSSEWLKLLFIRSPSFISARRYEMRVTTYMSKPVVGTE